MLSVVLSIIYILYIYDNKGIGPTQQNQNFAIGPFLLCLEGAGGSFSTSFCNSSGCNCIQIRIDKQIPKIRRKVPQKEPKKRLKTAESIACRGVEKWVMVLVLE